METTFSWHLGSATTPNVKLPKVIPYVIYFPTENGAYHLVVALKFIDPHYDPIALSKRIQQTLLEKTGGDSKDVGMFRIPHLSDGFHNENSQFNKHGNPSLADSPQTYFQFLCDYFAMTFRKERVLSAEQMDTLRHEASTMASDSNFDTYCSITHPLNLSTLFTWERLMNYFSKISYSSSEQQVLTNMEIMVKKSTIQDPEDPLSIPPATRVNNKYHINLKPLLQEPLGNYRFRCYRYPAEEFRWCYFVNSHGTTHLAGLAVEMMPHVHPVFQFEDDTYTEIVKKEKENSFPQHHCPHHHHWQQCLHHQQGHSTK